VFVFTAAISIALFTSCGNGGGDGGATITAPQEIFGTFAFSDESGLVSMTFTEVISSALPEENVYVITEYQAAAVPDWLDDPDFTVTVTLTVGGVEYVSEGKAKIVDSTLEIYARSNEIDGAVYIIEGTYTELGGFDGEITREEGGKIETGAICCITIEVDEVAVSYTHYFGFIDFYLTDWDLYPADLGIPIDFILDMIYPDATGIVVTFIWEPEVTFSSTPPPPYPDYVELTQTDTFTYGNNDILIIKAQGALMRWGAFNMSVSEETGDIFGSYAIYEIMEGTTDYGTMSGTLTGTLDNGTIVIDELDGESLGDTEYILGKVGSSEVPRIHGKWYLGGGDGDDFTWGQFGLAPAQ
jgi:hypothetical protein